MDKTNMNFRPNLVARLLDVNDEVFTTKELAGILGISKWGVLKRIKRGQIKAHKQGVSWYILKSEYVEMLRNS